MFSWYVFALPDWQHILDALDTSHKEASHKTLICVESGEFDADS